VREFCELAFHYAGLEHRKQPIKLVWEGKDAEEVGKDAATHQVLIRVDKRYFRPTEVGGWPPAGAADTFGRMV
jgi:GDPmannose 4,6-dehydratase